jgi:hypothetical protein
MRRSNYSPQQWALDRSAMPTDSQQPLLVWRGIFYQQVGVEPPAVGIYDLEDFVGEWDVAPTHDSAKAIINERLDPKHPEHQILMEAMRECDEDHARTAYEAYLDDLAAERAMERGL